MGIGIQWVSCEAMKLEYASRRRKHGLFTLDVVVVRLVITISSRAIGYTVPVASRTPPCF